MTSTAVNQAFQIGQEVLTSQCKVNLRQLLSFEVVNDSVLRKHFDIALDHLHYAKSCQRVGRCIRLCIISKGQWIGGIVLGSTFPAIDVRDRSLGLKQFVTNLAERGLRNAWCSDNVEYWQALQLIVNHARTFVFPQFQGQGFGKKAHKRLLSEGIEIWERRYKQKVYALDTLCDSSDSGLFLSNGWTLVGETKGYTADYRKPFTQKRLQNVAINNAALKLGRVQWQVWVRVIRPALRPKVN